MSAPERRVSPRKECVIPVRFRVLDAVVASGASVRSIETARGAATHGHFGTMEGKTVNLSERGVYFVSGEKVSVGQALEMYFTLPAQLTGRQPERVRCCARVVHAERLDHIGMTGVGAVVERFEPVASLRTWDN
jgi:PilZ domain